MKRLWSKQNWDAKHFRRLRIFATVRNLILVIFFYFNFFERNHFFFIKDKKMHGAGLSSSGEMALYAPL